MIEGRWQFILKVKKQTEDSTSDLGIFPQPMDLALGCRIHTSGNHWIFPQLVDSTLR